MNFRLAVWTVVFCLLVAVSGVQAGGPLPPHRQPQSRRDASLALLQFQNALAAGRWDDALALCSAEVQNRAKTWPSAEQFFKDTVPIEHVLARDFSCWSCGDNFYGLFETLSGYKDEPRIDWYWGIALTDGRWLVDYPPVRLPEYVEQRKAFLKAREEKCAALQRALSEKAVFISTRIVPLTNRFVLGQPMRFRVELTNAGPEDMLYLDTGLSHYGLTVREARSGTVLTNTAGPVQVMVHPLNLPAHSAVTVAEALDITRNHSITEPGKYLVQFDGGKLEIAVAVPMERTDRFGRTQDIGWGGHFSATNRFPSNILKIDVRR